MPSALGLRLCQWRLSNRDAGWETLAEAAHTPDRVNLLCEIPLDDAPRAPGSCAVFPRRSNRAAYELGNIGTGPGARGRARARRAAKQTYRARAVRELSQSRTLVELSLLVGAAPDSCTELDIKTWVCLWRANNYTLGHGTLAQSIGVNMRNKIRLRCALPADGSPRADGSCQVEVGS